MRLTKNELSIMEILWEEKRPLLSNEIVDLCKGKKWKSSSIHILINSLLEKKAIAVAGFEKIDTTNSNWAKTPLLSPC